jgi:hypothetical protein
LLFKLLEVASHFSDANGVRVLGIPIRVRCYRLLPPATIKTNDCYSIYEPFHDPTNSFPVNSTWGKRQCGNDTDIYVSAGWSTRVDSTVFVELICCRLVI